MHVSICIGRKCDSNGVCTIITNAMMAFRAHHGAAAAMRRLDGCLAPLHLSQGAQGAVPAMPTCMLSIQRVDTPISIPLRQPAVTATRH